MSFIASKMRSLFQTMSPVRGHSSAASADKRTTELEANSSTTANKLVDKLLDYLRDNYCKAIDPYISDTKIKLKPRKYVKLVIRSLRVDGLCNFERIGDAMVCKSDVKWRLGSHVLITDLLFDLNFCANITQIAFKHKNLRLFVEKTLVFIEIDIDLMSTHNTRVRQIRFVSIDGIDCSISGVIFPVNRTLEAIATKLVLNLCKHSETYSKLLVEAVNQYSDQFFDNLFTWNSLTELVSYSIKC